MKTVPQKYIILFGSIALIIVIISVFMTFASPSITVSESAKIFPYDKHTLLVSKEPLRIHDMRPGTAKYFMYPPDINPETDENHFQKFLIVRLPVWLGGAQDDVSSFRAYSAIDLSSHCILSHRTIQVMPSIIDPCTSPGYNVVDGISLAYPSANFARAPTTGALPMLELSTDKEGYLYVIPPTFTTEKNGAIGIGREVTENQAKAGEEFVNKMIELMEKKFEENHPSSLDSGHVLKISREYGFSTRSFYYEDPKEEKEPVAIWLEYCNCTVSTVSELEEREGTNQFGKFGMFGNTPLHAYPTAEKEVDGNKKLSNYFFVFYSNGFRITIETYLSLDSGIDLVSETYFDGTEPRRAALRDSNN